MIIKKQLYVLFFLVFIFSCINKQPLDIKGNWSLVLTDNKRYSEVFIDSLYFDVYDQSMSFWPSRIYKKNKNSLFLDLNEDGSYQHSYKVEFINKNKIILTHNKTESQIFLLKISSVNLTFDKIKDSTDIEKFKRVFVERKRVIMDSIFPPAPTSFQN